jgi:serpin B
MKAMKHLLIPVLLSALLAAACGGTEESGTTTSTVPGTATTQPSGDVQQGELARADVERIQSTDATEAELASLVTADTDFAFDLFRAAAADGENTLLSPYSVAAALTMTYAGARGQTATEMADVLGITLDQDRLHAVRNELDLQIATIDEPPAPGDEREPFSINVANSLWGQRGYPFLEEFLVLLAENYDAGMNLVDFAAAAEEARVAINDWVEEQTAGRIVDLIPPGVISDVTRLVLVNAIWFKASWETQFDPDSTADGTFTLLDGATVTVPMMNGGGMMPYATGDGYEYLRIPYAGDASMVIILPSEGRFAEVTQSLNSEFLADAQAGAAVKDVDLVMPKFEFTSEFKLKDALEKLGMTSAFAAPGVDGGADFTGITAKPELFIQDVVHKAFITVDETGTEAAAATAVIVGLTAVADPPIPVTLNRPFVFLIQHNSTGEVLFVGQVMNPAG